MKKIVGAILILLVLAVGCAAFLACDRVDDNIRPVELYEGMSAEDIFDLLEKSFSYSIVVGDEDYRFIRGRGYTKLEEGVFDGLVADGGVVYRMTDRDGVKVTTKKLDDDFYAEVDDVYDHYVKLLRESFENMVSKEPVEFKTNGNGCSAVIKIILRRNSGLFSIITCEIGNINRTSFFFPPAFKDYKSLAENA